MTRPTAHDPHHGLHLQPAGAPASFGNEPVDLMGTITRSAVVSGLVTAASLLLATSALAGSPDATGPRSRRECRPTSFQPHRTTLFAAQGFALQGCFGGESCAPAPALSEGSCRPGDQAEFSRGAGQGAQPLPPGSAGENDRCANDGEDGGQGPGESPWFDPGRLPSPQAALDCSSQAGTFVFHLVHTVHPPPTPEETHELEQLDRECRGRASHPDSNRQFRRAVLKSRAERWSKSRTQLVPMVMLRGDLYQVTRFRMQAYAMMAPGHAGHRLALDDVNGCVKAPAPWTAVVRPGWFEGELRRASGGRSVGRFRLTFGGLERHSTACGTLQMAGGETYSLVTTSWMLRARAPRPAWHRWMRRGQEDGGCWDESGGNGRPGNGDDEDRGGGDHGNNGVGNGDDPQPPGDPRQNDGSGTGPGDPGNGGGAGNGNGGNGGNGNSGGGNGNAGDGGNGNSGGGNGNAGNGGNGNSGGGNGNAGNGGNGNSGGGNGNGNNGDHGNNGVGNGEDPQPPGDPRQNDGSGTGPGDPGNAGGSGNGNSGNGNSGGANGNAGGNGSGNAGGSGGNGGNSGSGNSGNDNTGGGSKGGGRGKLLKRGGR